MDKQPTEIAPIAKVIELFLNAGICAFDRDECTVTIALDNEDQVQTMLNILPPKNRVYLAEDANP